jgi:hypothetical protein
VGVSFGGGTGGGVWLLVSTASAALYIHYSVYVLEPLTPGGQCIGGLESTHSLISWHPARTVYNHRLMERRKSKNEKLSCQ